MPAALIAPAIGAVGSVAGGISSGKGAAKAAKIQADAQAKQQAALRAMYDANVQRATPTFNHGEQAQTQLQSLLGLGGDPMSAQTTLENTPGYQFQVRQAMDSVNANAYAAGQGGSGAAIKALQDRAQNLAASNYNNYAQQLGSVADRGVSAMNGIVQQGNLMTQGTNQATQASADARSANSVYQGSNFANILKGVAGAAGSAFGSSYAPQGQAQQVWNNTNAMTDRIMAANPVPVNWRL